MAKRAESTTVAWFLAGLALGAAGAILLAPRSGRETRDSIAGLASRGRKSADDESPEAVEFDGSPYQRGVEFTGETDDSVVSQMPVGERGRSSSEG